MAREIKFKSTNNKYLDEALRAEFQAKSGFEDNPTPQAWQDFLTIASCNRALPRSVSRWAIREHQISHELPIGEHVGSWPYWKSFGREILPGATPLRIVSSHIPVSIFHTPSEQRSIIENIITKYESWDSANDVADVIGQYMRIGSSDVYAMPVFSMSQTTGPDLDLNVFGELASHQEVSAHKMLGRFNVLVSSSSDWTAQIQALESYQLANSNHPDLEKNLIRLAHDYTFLRLGAKRPSEYDLDTYRKFTAESAAFYLAKVLRVTPDEEMFSCINNPDVFKEFSTSPIVFIRADSDVREHTGVLVSGYGAEIPDQILGRFWAEKSLRRQPRQPSEVRTGKPVSRFAHLQNTPPSTPAANPGLVL